MSERRTEAIEVTIPLPPKQMHPNARSHWRAKLEPKAQQRYDARLAGLAALQGRAVPRWPAVSIRVTLYRNTGGGAGDPDNLIGWLKASIDGLQDAGIVGNDRNVTWLPPVQIVGKAANGERKVVLVISPITPEGT